MIREKIRIEIKCKNIAPLKNLNGVLDTNSLKIGVFASNGSGKTFISRAFRLTEKNKELELDEKGNSPTDKLISLGENKAEFDFKIINKQGEVTEDFNIELNRKKIPNIPDTNYLFHVFNEDYIEENLRESHYDKDGNIEGYILGKLNIDLSDDEAELKRTEKQGFELKKTIENDINSFVSKKIDGIQNIKRLNEYQLLNFDNILNQVDKNYGITKTYDELISDYNKVKSIPENLEDIDEIIFPELKLGFLKDIQEQCIEKFTLNTIAESLKTKIKNKQSFVETGISLLNKEGSNCPFCEQKLEDDALFLIDKYTKYFNDVESKTLKLLSGYSNSINEIIKQLQGLELKNLKRINLFNKYKNEYIPSLASIELGEFNMTEIVEFLKIIIEKISEKEKNIALRVGLSDQILIKISDLLKKAKEINNENKKLVRTLNIKKNNINVESKNIRKDLCRRSVDDLAKKNKESIHKLIAFRLEYKRLTDSILKKKEGVKISKKKKVAKTVQIVLNSFFSTKYSLDEDTFRLSFKQNLLEEKQAKDILSAGEKSILAFAFYIGETYLKVKNQEDYDRLFFIIDDPISSMDFSHVYTVCGVVRNLKTVIDDLQTERFMILTHNNEFMRILSSNNLIDSKKVLSKGYLKKYSNTLTVPYVLHLQDLYGIARKNELPTHTTANSIRHIIETLTKFEKFNIEKPNIKEYIKVNFDESNKTYTLIQDLSHGGWRSEQSPITDENYTEICEVIISHIEEKYKGQIDYCKKAC
ncbi:AAA domain-containing protein [Lutibacter oceani]|uniref:AAA domain-containing protein n=1 Tax=Lutibacter oceani TaxID=1853311 RepID=A0A3D9RT36_9FLAO|nr:AAA family ATPase [Lutibacter oceani]REE80684.1 AAA domain-containing protein [Lutibacter oceani]